MKNRVISERIESIRNSYYWTAQFWKEILLRNIGPVRFLERMEYEEIFRIAYYLIYLVKTLGPAQFLERMESYNFFGKLTIAFT